MQWVPLFHKVINESVRNQTTAVHVSPKHFYLLTVYADLSILFWFVVPWSISQILGCTYFCKGLNIFSKTFCEHNPNHGCPSPLIRRPLRHSVSQSVPFRWKGPCCLYEQKFSYWKYTTLPLSHSSSQFPLLWNSEHWSKQGK